MNYTLKTISMTDIARLPFKKESCNYVYKKEKDDTLQTGLIFKLEADVFNKVTNIFRGSSKHAITKGDKVYVLPGHSLSKPRIKEYLKSNGANTTEDITKATAIAGLREPSQRVVGHFQPLLNKLMVELGRGGRFKVDEVANEFFENSIERSEMKDSLHDESLSIYTTLPAYNYFKRVDEIGSVDHVYDTNFISAKGMELLYYILSNKLKVITEDYVTSNANSTVKLEDDEVYESIQAMLDSSDRNTYGMGIELLIHADLQGETLYKLWKLARTNGWKVTNYVKSKSVKHFLSSTEWSLLMSMTEESFLQYMKNNSRLELLAIKELIPVVYENNLSKIERRNNTIYFNVDSSSNAEKMTISLNDEWSKYLKMEQDEFIKQVQ